MDDLEKTIENLFFAPRTYVFHFLAICEFEWNNHLKMCKSDPIQQFFQHVYPWNLINIP